VPVDGAPSDEFVSLAEILTLDELGGDRWRGHTPPRTHRPDIFGGQVAGQCLRAAGHTIEGSHVPNSVHCYFLRRGQPDLPLDMSVERVRTGRTYASRRVEARQDDKVIFTMISSFHTPEPGREYDTPAPADVPDPESVPAGAWPMSRTGPIESRRVDSESPLVRTWGKVRGEFPAEPMMQYCALLYISDMHAGGAAMKVMGFDDQSLPVGEEGEPLVNFGSLDHSVWFHRPPAMDDWVFTEAHPVAVRDSRGLVLGTIHDRHGRHLASLSQEMFLKVLVGDL
jgi:acyl-CoA thioesterase-2